MVNKINKSFKQPCHVCTSARPYSTSHSCFCFCFTDTQSMKEKEMPALMPHSLQFRSSSGSLFSKSQTDAIVTDLVVGCSMPLSIKENGHFRHFMSVDDSKYQPVCHRTMASKTESLITQEKIKVFLAGADHVSVMVDIWSGRRMRGFLGVTGHFLATSEGVQLKSYLLACNRFEGPHTAERILASEKSLSLLFVTTLQI